MITSMTGAVKVNIREDMNGIPFAIKYFDDDHTLYISRLLFEEMQTDKSAFRYVTMAWKKDGISPSDMISQLKNQVTEYGKETGQIPLTQ